jgi:NitT/TauT family transport system substrate-binding protein
MSTMNTDSAPRIRPRPRARRLRLLTALLATALLPVLMLSACGDAADSSADAASTSVRLGFFPNVTHAPALVGIAEGTFEAALGETSLETFTFDAGTEAAEALLAGSLDLTFIGPNPAINAWAKSNGEAVRIVAGTTSGGAFLVVKPDITSPAQLAGKKIASPSLGNTQDVALRAWLKEQGFETTPEGGGDVTIIPQKNSTTLESFISGDIDGAWVPEPWATRLIDEGGGTVLVDERDLWTETDGEFVTTHLLVRADFLKDHPDAVKAVLEGLADAIEAIAADPVKAQADVVSQIGSITGSDPSGDVIAKSFANLTFTLDPIAASLQKSADDAIAVGLLDPVDLAGIHDLTLLNEILVERGEPEVTGL